MTAKLSTGGMLRAAKGQAGVLGDVIDSLAVLHDLFDQSLESTSQAAQHES
jgi:hypothetical protein